MRFLIQYEPFTHPAEPGARGVRRGPHTERRRVIRGLTEPAEQEEVLVLREFSQFVESDELELSGLIPVLIPVNVDMSEGQCGSGGETPRFLLTRPLRISAVEPLVRTINQSAREG